jgi:hypothetical protein
MTYPISSRMIVRPETPTSYCDAELCARLCRQSRWWREQILWDTVTIKRYPDSAWIEGYDEVVISGHVQPSRG